MKYFSISYSQSMVKIFSFRNKVLLMKVSTIYNIIYIRLKITHLLVAIYYIFSIRYIQYQQDIIKSCKLCFFKYFICSLKVKLLVKE